MEKGGELRRGGCSRLSTPTRLTGGDGDGIFDNTSKKEKLRRISEMDQISHSLTTNSTSERFKLPKKFSDHRATIIASVPRKLRSVVKKQEHEYPQVSNNEIGKFELALNDCTKKHKSNVVVDHVTKDEEETAEALLMLAPPFLNQAEPSKPAGSLVHTKPLGPHGSPVHTIPDETEPLRPPGSTVHTFPDETEPLGPPGSQVHMFPDETEPLGPPGLLVHPKTRNSAHVYICHLIGVLKSAGPNQAARVNVISDTNPHRWLPLAAGGGRPETSSTPLHNHLCVHHHPPIGRPPAPEQVPPHPRWFVTGGRSYQNWPNGSLVSNKKLLRTSGYDENGSLFLVDSIPTLELTL